MPPLMSESPTSPCGGYALGYEGRHPSLCAPCSWPEAIRSSSRQAQSEGWRRGRDSNPRYRLLPVRRFSKPLLSTTQPPLRALIINSLCPLARDDKLKWIYKGGIIRQRGKSYQDEITYTLPQSGIPSSLARGLIAGTHNSSYDGSTNAGAVLGQGKVNPFSCRAIKLTDGLSQHPAVPRILFKK